MAERQAQFGDCLNWRHDVLQSARQLHEECYPVSWPVSLEDRRPKWEEQYSFQEAAKPKNRGSRSEVRWQCCQEFLNSAAEGSLGQIVFLNLISEAVSVKLKPEFKRRRVKGRDVKCLAFVLHFLHLIFGVCLSRFLHLKLFAKLFQLKMSVLSFHSVVSCASLFIPFLWWKPLEVKPSNSEAV